MMLIIYRDNFRQQLLYHISDYNGANIRSERWYIFLISFYLFMRRLLILYTWILLRLTGTPDSFISHSNGIYSFVPTLYIHRANSFYYPHLYLLLILSYFVLLASELFDADTDTTWDAVLVDSWHARYWVVKSVLFYGDSIFSDMQLFQKSFLPRVLIWPSFSHLFSTI